MSDRSGFSEVVAELPPRDHNQPPELLPIGEQMVRGLEAANEATIARADDIIEAGKRVPAEIDTPELERKATDFVRTIQACIKALESSRVGAKEPYLTAERQLDGFFKKQTDPLDELKTAIERRLTTYKNKVRQAEQDRRDAEAAERRRIEAEAAKARAEEEARQRLAAAAAAKAKAAAEEAERAAARKRNEQTRAEAEKAAAESRRLAAAAEEEQRKADEAATAARARETEAANLRADAEGQTNVKAADITRARGDFSVGSLQEFIDKRDMIRGTIDVEKLREHFTTDALEKAINAWVKANSDLIKDELKNGRQPLRGVTLFINHRTNVR